MTADLDTLVKAALDNRTPKGYEARLDAWYARVPVRRRLAGGLVLLAGVLFGGWWALAHTTPLLGRAVVPPPPELDVWAVVLTVGLLVELRYVARALFPGGASTKGWWNAKRVGDAVRFALPTKADAATAAGHTWKTTSVKVVPSRFGDLIGEFTPPGKRRPRRPRRLDSGT